MRRKLNPRRRGNAMLEFLLTLPVYLVILFAVQRAGMIGRYETELHIATRHAAWNQADPGRTRNLHFRQQDQIYIPPAAYVPLVAMTHEAKSVARYVRAFEGMGEPAAYAIPHGAFGAPLPVRDSSADKDDPKPSSERLADLKPNSYNHLTDDEFKFGKILLATAMEGDVEYESKPADKDAVPWLRRRYATGAFGMAGSGWVGYGTTFRTQYTVLLTQGHYSERKNAYSNQHPATFGSQYVDIFPDAPFARTLRNPRTYSIVAQLLGGGGIYGLNSGHQLDILGGKKDLPGYPGFTD